jgi:hypothetical protein
VFTSRRSPQSHKGHKGPTESPPLRTPKRKPIAIASARHIIAVLKSSSSPAALTRHSRLNAENRALYKPNFCCECGNKLIRLRWHFWTSRRFCNVCARRFRKQRFVPVLLLSLALLTSGYLLRRTRQAAAPPLIIVRRADSPLNDSPFESSASATTPNSTSAANAIEGDVYLCGARTKKGTPCSRRVHGPVRCWQHKGMPPMLPQEKLLVKG